MLERLVFFRPQVVLLREVLSIAEAKTIHTIMQTK